MLKNITLEQAEWIKKAQENPEFKKILDRAIKDESFAKAISSLTNEEIDYLNKMVLDPELKEQFGIVFSYEFMNFIKENGYTETLKMFSEFSHKFTNGLGDRFQKVATIFDYINYLLYYDDIMKSSSKDMTEESIEALISLKEYVDEKESPELRKGIEKARAELQSLTVKNEELSSTNKALSEDKDTLSAKISELQKQEDDLRSVLDSNLEKEMNEKRTIEQFKIDSELNALIELRNNILLELQQLESKLDYYGIDSSLPSSEPQSDVEVVWEPINIEHPLFSQNSLSIEDYVDGMINEYQRKTGKSEEESNYDFLINCPVLPFVIRSVKKFNYWYICCTSITGILEYKNWDTEKTSVEFLYNLLQKVKLPRYIIKEKDVSINNDNIQNYLTLLKAKANIARLEAEKKAIEANFNSFVEKVTPYLPDNIDLGLPNKDEQYKLIK